MGRRKRTPRLDCRPPGRRKKAKWDKLIKLCTKIVLLWPPGTITQKSPLVQLVWPVVNGEVMVRPKDWPLSKSFTKTDTTFTAKYNCESILDWFYARHYINYTVDELYEQRHAMLSKINSEQAQFESFLKFGEDV